MPKPKSKYNPNIIPPGHFANSPPNENANFDYSAPIPAMLLQVWSTIALTVLTPRRNCLTQVQVIALVTTPQILHKYAKDRQAYQDYLALDETTRSKLVQNTFTQKNYCTG